MKKLSEIYDIDSNVIIKDIKINSKEILEGDLFVCTTGATVDRHDFIDDAISRGASAIVVSKDIKDKSVPIVKVENTNKELPYLCQRFWDNPQLKLKMIGVTGTDGKTSVATMTQILMGKDECGYIGTNGRSCGKFEKSTNNTTPDADKLYMYLNEFLEAGCKEVAMECSSEAFLRGRLTNVEFDVAAITNITKEHLNIHGTFENYIDCKAQLFRQVKSNGVCVLNKDDDHFEVVKEAVSSTLYTYGKDEDNTLQIVDYKVTPEKTFITYRFDGKDYNVESPLLGDFNVYNLACSILMCVGSGRSIESVLENISNLKVSGRLEMLPNIGQDFYTMVDYAHTPNGISKLLEYVHVLDINRSIVVIGAAGTRDPYKRPTMGKVAVENASHVIFTYEDPRSEDPLDIINSMISEIQDTHDNYEIVVDREEAIKKAIEIAETKDIVLILGKGSENYQVLKDRTIHFNDIEVASKYVKEKIKKSH